ncbi:MAG TPA: rod shape-determining protein MreD [Actinobacteria bacterium]|nr:rod shape-determining protein MreD [Actinomycetota bacterium]
MRSRGTALALVLVVAAVVAQTTVFGADGVRPFGSAPNLVLLLVVVCARWLDPEPALFLGFTAGLLVDLLGSAPLGIWAMCLTVVAYLTLRVREHVADGPFVVAVGILGLTLVGQLLFVVLGTLFGLQTISDPQLPRKLVLPALYNVALAAPAFWLGAKVLRPHQRTWVGT